MKRLKVGKHSEQLKVLVFLMLLVSLVLSAVAVGGSIWIHNIVSKNVIQGYEKKLDSTIEHIKVDIGMYQSQADQYSNTKWVKEIAYMQGDKIDLSRVNNLDLEQYRDTVRLQSHFSNVYESCLAFFDKDLAVGSSARCNMNYMANNYLKADNMSKADWIAFGQEASQGKTAVRMNVKLERFGSKTDAMLLAFPVNPSPTQSAAALYIVIRHRDFVEKYFSDMLEQEENVQLLIRELGEDTPFIVAGKEPADQVVTVCAELKELGISTELILPRFIVLDEVIAVRNVMFIFVVALWVIAAGLSFIVSDHLLRPLRNLLNMLNVEDAIHQEYSEYEALQNGINQLIESETAMKKELSVRRILLRNAQLERLINGVQLQKDEMFPMFRFDGCSKYCVCLLIWETGAEKMPLPEQMEEEIKNAVENGDACNGVVLRRAPHDLLVVGYARSEEFEKAIVALLDKWENLCIAIGSEEEELTKLNNSYAAAKKARDYRCVAEGYRVLRQDNISQMVSYYLPREQGDALLRFVSCGQANKAKAVFAHLYESNMAENMTTEKGMQNFIFNINLMLAKQLPAECDANLMDTTDFENGITALYAATEQNIDIVAEKCRQKYITKSARMESILNYVDANIAETTLSLDMVAGYFGISSSLVSRLFTEQHGERFHDYVNKQRVQKAMEYLASLDGKMDISAIALSVGYTSDATFRRLFKKYVGLSPSEYRSNIWKT